MSETTGLLSISSNIITTPQKAFEQVRSIGGAWFPLVVIIVFGILMNVYYFQSVNHEWFIEQNVLAQAANASPAEQEIARNQMNSMGPNMFLIIGVVGTIIMVPLIYAIVGLFLLIVSNIRNDNLSYGQCFTIVSWSGLIKIFSVIVGFVSIFLASNGQIAQHDISGLNLNMLMFQVDVTHPWYSWLTQFDLIGIWSAVVMGLGYRIFTNASMVTSVIVGLLPTILYFGILAAFI